MVQSFDSQISIMKKYSNKEFSRMIHDESSMWQELKKKKRHIKLMCTDFNCQSAVRNVYSTWQQGVLLFSLPSVAGLFQMEPWELVPASALISVTMKSFQV